MHIENITKLLKIKRRLGKEKGIINRKISVINHLISASRFMDKHSRANL